MWRLSMFCVVALLSARIGFAQVTSAQVTDDPQAAAPVVYSDAPSAADCGSPLRNADGSPVMNCEPEAVADEAANAAELDDAYDEAPVYDSPYYDSGDYYPGVSLLPAYGYASYGFGWGWPYYAYAPFGYWPYFNFAFYAGGYRHGHRGWHGHDGGNHHDGHGHGYHGPYRYVGNGRYWDETHPRAGTRGATASRFAGTSPRGVQGGVQDRASFASRNPASRTASATRALPSASYYAASRGMANYPVRTAAGMTNRSATMASGARSVGARNPYWVTSMPSSRYAPSARAANGNAQRAYSGYRSANRGYAPGMRLPPNSFPSRTGYVTPRSSEGYRGGYHGGYSGRSSLNASRAGSSHAMHMPQAAPRVSGGGGHASGGHAVDHRGR